jgi:transcription antitermination factor NusG
MLRTSLGSGVRAKPHPLLTVGRMVRVKKGPMAGLQGILKRSTSRARLVVCIERIRRAIALEIDEADIEPVR